MGPLGPVVVAYYHLWYVSGTLYGPAIITVLLHSQVPVFTAFSRSVYSLGRSEDCFSD